MSYTVLPHVSTGELATAALHNELLDDIAILKTSISDDGTVWSGSITVATTAANATFNFVIVAGAGASAPKISSALTYNPSTGVFTGSISNQTTGFRINGAAVIGTLLRGDGTNYVASATTYPDTVASGLLLYASAANVVSGLATANNGVLITSGAGVPSISSTLPTAVQDTITRVGTLTSGATGAGFTIALSTSTITGTLSASLISGTLGAANGGTGQSSYAVGDLLYASGATALSKLADVAVGSYLRSGGVTTAPLWSTLILPNAATANQIVYATATNTWGASASLTFDGTTLAAAALTISGTVGLLSATNYIGSRSVANIPLHIQDAAHDDTGLDLYRVSATEFQLQSYNRAGSAYTTLSFNALNFLFTAGATTIAKLHNSGGVSVGDTTDPGATNLRVVGKCDVLGALNAQGVGVYTAAVSTILSSGDLTLNAGTDGGKAIVLNDLPRFNTGNTTGAGSAALGSNSPAVTNTAPYTWIKAFAADGSTIYIPAWK